MQDPQIRQLSPQHLWDLHRHCTEPIETVLDLEMGECVGNLGSPSFSPCGNFLAVHATFMLDCAPPILLLCHAASGQLAARVSCTGLADYTWSYK